MNLRFNEEEKTFSKAKALVCCIRRMIMEGELSPGDKLPSTQELAAQLDTSIANAQRSLSALSHEGLLERRPHHGTVVCNVEKKLKIVAIIIFTKPERGPKAYQQSLAGLLAAEFRKRGCEAIILTENFDNPDFSRMEKVLHEIGAQAIIPFSAPGQMIRYFLNINIPMATTSGIFKNNGVYSNIAELPILANGILQKEKCRRPALISNLEYDQTVYWSAIMHNRMLDGFKALLERYSPEDAEELFCLPSMLPGEYQPNEVLTEFAYRSVTALLSRSDAPDALIVISDELAQGVFQAVLKSSRNPLLILYRNREIPFFSPLPAYYIEISLREMALALINIVEQKFKGEETQKALVHYTAISPQ